MNTDDLIAALARGDVAVTTHSVGRRFAIGVGAGWFTTVMLMVETLGVRGDLGSALQAPMFWVKVAFAASLALASLAGVVRLSRPGARLGHVPAVMLAPVATLWVLATVSLYATVPRQRAHLMLGDTWNVCPFLIAGLAVPVFVGTLWAIKGLAPTRLRLTGATAGLTSGAFATLAYSLHCPEMAAPFVAAWYVVGITMPAALGALLGPYLLRW